MIDLNVSEKSIMMGLDFLSNGRTSGHFQTRVRVPAIAWKPICYNIARRMLDVTR